MPSMSELASAGGTKPYKAEWEGITVTGEYRPGAITGELISNANAVPLEDRHEALASIIVACVDSWDITTDDLEPIEVTLKACRPLPVGLLFAIVKSMGEASGPDPTNESSFGGG